MEIMEINERWTCEHCSTHNLFEDRYCGECGEPRDPTIVVPILRAPETVSGILPDFHEPPAWTRAGLAAVVVTGLVTAVLFGAAYYGVTRLIHIKILYPILLGGALGAAIKLAALKGRGRHERVLLVTALVAGLAAYGIRQVLDTLREQAEYRRHFEDIGRTAPESGFFRILKKRADAGISIGALRSDGRNAITGAGFWIFVLAEAGLAAGLAVASVYGISRRPFCDRCRLLVSAVPVFRVNGRDADKLTSAVRRQKWKAAKSLSDRASPSPTDRAEASLLKCSNCEGSSLRVDVHDGKGSRRTLHVALPADSLRELARSG